MKSYLVFIQKSLRKFTNPVRAIVQTLTDSRCFLARVGTSFMMPSIPRRCTQSLNTGFVPSLANSQAAGGDFTTMPYQAKDETGTDQFDMGDAVPVFFSQLTLDSLLNRVREYNRIGQEIEKDVEALHASKNNEWLTVDQFRRRAGLTHKTVCNYAATGRIEKVYKEPNGEWKIHKSELESYQR